MVIEEENPVPTGFLNPTETRKFDNTLPQIEKRRESSNTWLWILGALLLAVGL